MFLFCHSFYGAAWRVGGGHTKRSNLSCHCELSTPTTPFNIFNIRNAASQPNINISSQIWHHRGPPSALGLCDPSAGQGRGQHLHPAQCAQDQDPGETHDELTTEHVLSRAWARGPSPSWRSPTCGERGGQSSGLTTPRRRGEARCSRGRKRRQRGLSRRDWCGFSKTNYSRDGRKWWFRLEMKWPLSKDPLTQAGNCMTLMFSC